MLLHWEVGTLTTLLGTASQADHSEYEQLRPGVQCANSAGRTSRSWELQFSLSCIAAPVLARVKTTSSVADCILDRNSVSGFRCIKYSELNLLLLYVFVARVDVFADLNFHYITNAPLRPGGELGMDRCPLLHVVCTDRANFHSS